MADRMSSKKASTRAAERHITPRSVSKVTPSTSCTRAGVPETLNLAALTGRQTRSIDADTQAASRASWRSSQWSSWMSSMVLRASMPRRRAAHTMASVTRQNITLLDLTPNGRRRWRYCSFTEKGQAPRG